MTWNIHHCNISNFGNDYIPLKHALPYKLLAPRIHPGTWLVLREEQFWKRENHTLREFRNILVVVSSQVKWILSLCILLFHVSSSSSSSSSSANDKRLSFLTFLLLLLCLLLCCLLFSLSFFFFEEPNCTPGDSWLVLFEGFWNDSLPGRLLLEVSLSPENKERKKEIYTTVSIKSMYSRQFH